MKTADLNRSHTPEFLRTTSPFILYHHTRGRRAGWNAEDNFVGVRSREFISCLARHRRSSGGSSVKSQGTGKKMDETACARVHEDPSSRPTYFELRDALDRTRGEAFESCNAR